MIDCWCSKINFCPYEKQDHPFYASVRSWTLNIKLEKIINTHLVMNWSFTDITAHDSLSICKCLFTLRKKCISYPDLMIKNAFTGSKIFFPYFRCTWTHGRKPCQHPRKNVHLRENISMFTSIYFLSSWRIAKKLEKSEC